MKGRISVLALAALLASCWEPTGNSVPREAFSLDVYNNSQRTVVVMPSLEEVDGIVAPSTGLMQEVLCNFREVTPGQKGWWSFFPDEMNIKVKDPMAVFVFSPDTLSKYTWPQVKADSNFLRKYVISIQQRVKIDYP